MGAFDHFFVEPPYEDDPYKGPFTPDPNGVWAIVVRDHYPTIDSVYPTEIEALRAINGRGYGKVVFVPWGKTLVEMEED